MKATKGWLVGIVGSLAIALLISLIPVIQLKADEPVFAYRVPQTLDRMHLVDFLASVPMTARMERVSWKDHVLEIDLSVQLGQRLTADELYRTLYALSSHALLGTTNVQELLVRILWEQPDEPPLLLASFVAHRTDLAKDPRMSNVHQLPLELYLSHLFKLTKTASWYHYFMTSSDGS
ncbi:MAG: hypothetical protein C0P68_005115 [Bacillota bacterium]|nr:hypothetical protein [Bacillota bacterium]